MRTCGLVLAAGRSERFGSADKLLAPLNGRPLAAHSAKAMRAVQLDHRLVVVTNPAVAALFGGFEVLEMEQEDAPQSASLALGARQAMARGADRLLIALADMPLVDADLLTTVLHHATKPQPSAATDGARAMPPACFPASWFTALTEISGDRGASSLLRELPPSALVPAPDGMLADVDTPDDLETLQRAVSESPATWE